MSKNHPRGEREAKKPKKEKYAAASVATSGALWATVEKLRAHDRDKK